MLKASLYFERQILERIKANDRKVLGELYKKYQRLIFGHVIKNGGNEKDAEDILQETVITIWQKVSAGNFELNQDGTFRSSGMLDGDKIFNSGIYEIDPKNNKLILLPSDSDKKQVFSLSIRNDNSFAVFDIDKSTGLVMKRT